MVKTPKENKIYSRKIINATKEERQLVNGLIKTTYGCPVFKETLRTVRSNSLAFGLKVMKSKMKKLGRGIANMASVPVAEKTLIAYYPATIGVNPDDYWRKPDPFSAYRLDLGVYGESDELQVKLYANGAPSDEAFNGANINHSCAPNCEFVPKSVPGGVDYHVIETIEPILPGEEATVDYGPGYWRPVERIKPVPRGFKIVQCICGHCPTVLGHLVPV